MHYGDGQQTILVEYGGRTFMGRDFLPKPQWETLVKTHHGIEEVSRDGRRSVFRFGGYEFDELLGAVAYRLKGMSRWDVAEKEVTLEGTTITKRTQQCKDELEEFVAGIERDLGSKLIEAFRRPGPWHTIIFTENDGARRKHERSSREDLLARVEGLFGDQRTAWLWFKAAPEIFKKALGSVPQGKSESEILKEKKELARKIREKQQSEIHELEELAEKLSKTRS